MPPLGCAPVSDHMSESNLTTILPLATAPSQDIMLS